MRATTVPVPIEYHPLIHRVQTTCTTAAVGAESNRHAFRRAAARPSRVDAVECTLLELVQAVGEVTEDDREVVATVVHLLESGQVRLCGNFRDEPIELILAS